MPFDAATVEFLSFPDLLKATPSEEAGERFVYLEASNEARDYQGEVVLAKALAESADYYLRFGNLDLDHITQIGPKAGIGDYAKYEIGRPVDVRVHDGRTFVKGQLYRGDGPMAERANEVWDSLTNLSPPARWYPSVGGAVLEKAQDFDPQTRSARTVIRKVRWTNIGLSKTPVNLAVPSVSTVPIGVLAKCWGPAGLDLSKALEAGYGTDSATLTGGAALRKQSLDRRLHSYWDIRDRLAGDLRKSRVRPDPAAMADHLAGRFGLSKADAAEMVERFLADLKAGLSSPKQKDSA